MTRLRYASLGSPDSGKDLETHGGEVEGGIVANAGGAAGDDDGAVCGGGEAAHGELLVEESDEPGDQNGDDEPKEAASEKEEAQEGEEFHHASVKRGHSRRIGRKKERMNEKKRKGRRGQRLFSFRIVIDPGSCVTV